MTAMRFLACTCLTAAALVIASPAIADDGAIIDASAVAISSDSLSSDLADYSAWEDAVATAPLYVGNDVEVGEPVSVPEPSAFAMIAGLAALLLAMTVLRWHFDRATTPAPTK